MRNRIRGTRFLNKQWIMSLLLAVLFIFPGVPAEAATTVYTDFDSWGAALPGHTIESLITTAGNVALADGVDLPLGPNTDVGSNLTFQAVNTGLFYGFAVQTLQSGAQFTFDDDYVTNMPNFDNALSVGNMDVYEDDDWRLSLLDGAGMTAFGIKMIDSKYQSGESMGLYYNNSLIDTVNLGALGNYNGTHNFLGIISDSTFDRVDFNEGDDGDDIAIADFSFASANSPVAPEPVSSVLFVAGGTLLAVRRFLRRKVKA